MYHTLKSLAPSAAIAAGLAFIASGCASQRSPELQPADEANEVLQMPSAAWTIAEDVSVVVRASEWPGAENIKDDVTPLGVVIENDSDKPLRIRYSEFALIAADGTRYDVISPFDIGGTAEKPALVEDYRPIEEPLFVFDEHFFIAPLYAPLYGIHVYGEWFPYDLASYKAHKKFWKKHEDLPTAEMIRRALPEGVLEPGGRVEGYLYFEKVKNEANRLAFRADLVNADSGMQFAEARIPLVIETGIQTR